MEDWEKDIVPCKWTMKDSWIVVQCWIDEHVFRRKPVDSLD